MKKEVSPAIVAVIIIVVVAVVGAFIWRGTSTSGSKPPGAVGNPGPFTPGGAANGQGGAKPANVGAPRGPGGTGNSTGP